MKRNNRIAHTLHSPESGFTIIELMIAMILVAILIAMAIPSFNSWRENIEYRDATNDVFSKLRDAKGRAIETNRQYRFEVMTATKQYQVLQGNRAHNSTVWNAISTPTTLKPSVYLGGAVNATVDFNPNGAASEDFSLDIKDVSGANRYVVNVEQTGRIRTDKGK